MKNLETVGAGAIPQLSPDVPLSALTVSTIVEPKVDLGRLFLVVLLAFISVGFGCHKTNSAGRSTGNAKATWNFWQIVQEPIPRNTLFNRMESFSAENANAEDMVAMALVLRQVAQACIEKASQITTASVVNVDIDAANFGVKKAQMLVGYAKLFQSAAQLTERQSQLTSGEAWGLGYVFALARHSDEGEDAWWNAGKEELADKAKTFGNLQVDNQNLAAFAQEQADTAAELQTLEMQARITLNQKFGREFPTTQALKAKKPAASSVAVSAEQLKIMESELMKNLIGRKIKTIAGGTWTFDAPGEIKTFSATHGTNYGDVLDFEVATHVRGFLSGQEHDFVLLMTYQKQDDSMRLMFVKPL